MNKEDLIQMMFALEEEDKIKTVWEPNSYLYYGPDTRVICFNSDVNNNTSSICSSILNEVRFSKRHAGDDYGHQKPNDKSKKYPPQSGL